MSDWIAGRDLVMGLGLVEQAQHTLAGELPCATRGGDGPARRAVHCL